MKLYLNGTLVKTINISGEINAHDEPLRIGGEKQGAYFEGMIDEVKIYNEALSAAEILDHYNAVVNPVTDATISPQDVIFDKNSPNDVTITMELNENELIALKNGEVELVNNTDYIISEVDHTVTIKQEYLMQQPIGVSDITFDFSAGSDPVLTITVEGNEIGTCIGQWTFDEGEGTTAADASGNNNHGTIAGPTWTNGVVGKALSFSGNGCVEVSHHASLNPRNALTIEAWVNPSTNMNWRKVISKSVGNNTDYCIFQGAENNIAFSIKMGNIARTAYAPANSVPLGEWTYVVGTYDGCRMKLYLNGTLVKTINISGEINVHNEPLRIGGEKQGAYFEGMIDEVKIYNEAITAEEILDKYENDINPISLADEDNDELPDIYEKNILLPGMVLLGQELANPSPTDDYDQDGLTNLEEYHLGTNPSSKDTDEDGLSDYDEVNTYNTNPNLYDTDEDSMGDGTEIINGLDPLSQDSDGDGIIDSEEVFEQKLIDAKYQDIDISKTKVKPSVTMTGSGDYSKQIEIADASLNDVFAANNSIIGAPFEIAHDSELSFQNARISFSISDEALQSHRFQDMAVAWYNVENNDITILESEIDDNTNTVSADVEHFSYYCVVDLSEFYYNIDLDNPESIITSGKADVVFVVDTTGSMSSPLQNVKNNINSFVNRLQEEKVDVRLGLVEYRDIYVDGKDTTKVLGWFTDVNDFKSRVSLLGVGGGGDTPESAVDALEVARNMKYRSGVQKYIILLTDAHYKNGTNTEGISTMEDEIPLLKQDGITVSVVGRTKDQTIYANLYTQTDGVFGDITLNFVTALESLIAKMGEQSNDGAWVRLANGTIVQLAQDPKLGDYAVDTDGDGVPDLFELNEEVEKGYFDFASGTWKTLKYWTFTTNPIKIDSDGDGLDDGLDMNPAEYDVIVVNQTDSKVELNNGKVWQIFGVDI